MKIQKVISERKFKTGYIIRDELIDPEFSGTSQPLRMKSAYNYNGDYIGNSKSAHYLCTKRGILPEVIPGNKVCSIGFCEKEQKWYGWSHRAIYGFGIGDVTKLEQCGVPQYIKAGFKAKTLKDAMKIAIAFAQSVS
jgi:hypothetical protein